MQRGHVGIEHGLTRRVELVAYRLRKPIGDILAQ
jgi:hypothetical protein